LFSSNVPKGYENCLIKIRLRLLSLVWEVVSLQWSSLGGMGAEEVFKSGKFSDRTFRSVDVAVKRLFIVLQTKKSFVPQIRLPSFGCYCKLKAYVPKA